MICLEAQTNITTGQAPIASFFKPIAYTLILLRSQGQPCVFYGDLYGIKEDVKRPLTPSCGGKLPTLIHARKLYAYGEQRDYFDRPNCVGLHSPCSNAMKN